jgi:hypothetical protein
MAIRRYAKGSRQHVQMSFEAGEFDCRCTRPECNFTLIDEDLVLALQRLHNEVLLPIHITEGFRCAARQAELRGARNADGTPKYLTANGTSSHELGMAADLRTGKHSGVELEALARKVGFKAVGVGERFIHVDTRDILTTPEKTRRWVYPY